MNTTKVRQEIANVYKSVAYAFDAVGIKCRREDHVTGLRVALARLIEVGDTERPSGAADLYLSRMMGDAITAGESTLKFLEKSGEA